MKRKKQTIYVIMQNSGYESEGYSIGDTYIIEAFEAKEDAMLALWYWYISEMDRGHDAKWYETYVLSEGDDPLSEWLNREIVETSFTTLEYEQDDSYITE